jgi:2-oxoisovalerate dehydrogenase E1 component beta subunit
LLTASIRDPNPVLFLEPKILYRSAQELVPVDDYELALAKADILQTGTDLTIVSWGTPIYTVEQALAILRNPPVSVAALVPDQVRSLSIEVIDLRTIAPYDIETVVNSVNKTGRLIVVHEAGQTGGVGAELAAEVQKRCFLRLEAPVQRVAGWE